MDYPDHLYPDDTFKTGFDLEYNATDRELKLPNVVNFVALRETFLSEAPFINIKNRYFWKKWIDSKQYVNVFAASLSFISDCFNENGSLNMNRMNDVNGNFYIEQMATSISEMILMNKSRNKNSYDLLFRKLPELLCYMIVNSLQSCFPRHSRIHNSKRFREILLDWIGEMIGGMRMTDCRKDRDWLFADANEAAVMIDNYGYETRHEDLNSTGSPNSRKRSSTLRSAGANVLNRTDSTSTMNKSSSLPALNSLSSAVSRYHIKNSPLIDIYLNVGRSEPYLCQHSSYVNLSHIPNRPVTTIKTDGLVREGKFREKKILDDQLKQSMKLSSQNRKSILNLQDKTKRSTADEMRRLRQSYKLQMSMLGSGKATNKQLLQVAVLESGGAGATLGAVGGGDTV